MPSYRVFCLLLLVTTHSLAQDTERPPNRIGIAPFFIELDDDRLPAEDGSGLHLIFNRPWNDRWSWEANVSYSILDTGNSAGTDHYQSNIGVDVVRRFGELDRLNALVWMGGGLANNDVFPDSNDDISPFVNVAVGLESRPLGASRVKARGRVVFVHDDFLSGMTDWRLELGVTLPLGRDRVVERIIEREVIVESPPQIVYREPPDDDRDGVMNDADLCPNTLPGAAVDSSGCIRDAQAVELDGVNFETGSSNLTESAERILDRVFLALRDQPDVTVEVAGHTDSVGSETNNLRLSQARADSVVSYLRLRGIAPERLSARGYGESEPVRSEVTDADRAVNRRVEFRIQETNP